MELTLLMRDLSAYSFKRELINFLLNSPFLCHQNSLVIYNSSFQEMGHIGDSEVFAETRKEMSLRT